MTTEDITSRRTYELWETFLKNIHFLICEYLGQVYSIQWAQKGKRNFEIMFYFELSHVTAIPWVISTHGSGNNVKKVFWRMTFISFIKVA